MQQRETKLLLLCSWLDGIDPIECVAAEQLNVCLTACLDPMNNEWMASANCNHALIAWVPSRTTTAAVPCWQLGVFESACLCVCVCLQR